MEHIGPIVKGVMKDLKTRRFNPDECSYQNIVYKCSHPTSILSNGEAWVSCRVLRNDLHKCPMEPPHAL